MNSQHLKAIMSKRTTGKHGMEASPRVYERIYQLQKALRYIYIYIYIYIESVSVKIAPLGFNKNIVIVIINRPPCLDPDTVIVVV